MSVLECGITPDSSGVYEYLAFENYGRKTGYLTPDNWRMGTSGHKATVRDFAGYTHRYLANGAYSGPLAVKAGEVAVFELVGHLDADSVDSLRTAADDAEVTCHVFTKEAGSATTALE